MYVGQKLWFDALTWLFDRELLDEDLPSKRHTAWEKENSDNRHKTRIMWYQEFYSLIS